MKEFLLKYKVYIAIGVLLVLFIVLSLLMGNDVSNNKEFKEDVSAWLEDTKKDEYTVTVLAQTFCGACKAYRPYMQEVYNENDINLYWFDVDKDSSLTEEQITTVTSTYELENFGGTPYTFITKNGEVVAHYDSSADKATILNFLKTNNVIE